MINKLGENFDTLGQRILYSYVATYPVFKPIKKIDVTSQQQLHDFMYEVLTSIYENPSLIGIEAEPDDCYKGYALNNTKPELIKSMEKIEAKFYTFIMILVTIGKHGYIEDHKLIISKKDMNIVKATKEKLEAFGISIEQDKESSVLQVKKYPDLFPAWQFFSQNDDESAQKITRAITFIHGRYAEQLYTTADFFQELLPDTTLLCKMEAFFHENGYTLSNFDLNNKTRYAYVKWIKEYPDKETSYFKAYFNWRKDQQMIYEFKVPGFRLLLNDYQSMEPDMQTFIFNHLKTCDGCGYCTQMDKTGKRPCLALSLSADSETAMKCPLYPWFTWNELLNSDMEQMIKLYTLAEEARKK